jgi:glyoxylase-like metal-dependent hydrolase (beta-lactamase superfamily II)
MSSILQEIAAGILIDDQDHAITGVLTAGASALLVNATHPGLVARLRAAGIERVERVLFSSHRRELADGLPEVLAEWSPALVVPEAERALFEDPAAYWADERSRWRLLCGHVPYHVTHASPLPVAQGVVEGDVITWHDWQIRVLATPGYTDGSVTYLVRRGAGPVLAFTGDLIWGPGQVRDLYSLQHEAMRNGHQVGDYHGFMGSMVALLESLERVLAHGPARLLPAHGVVIDRPLDAVALLRARFQAAYHNYVSISALRWYFPTYFGEHSTDGETLPQQETFERPPNVRILSGTTWALVADDGHALLIDPYSPAALAAAEQAVAGGEITAFDGIWITHFHYDHMDCAEEARQRFGIPVFTDQVMADVISHPERFFLTCLSPVAVTVASPTVDGQTWRWRNYRLTAYHFPGQTYYHSGLHVVPDHGPSLFFAGDAVTPSGIDDYCAWNRNGLGDGVGFDRCLKLLRGLNPDLIFNQHVEVGFRFSAAAYEVMLRTLREREALYRALLPWEHSNFGTDEYWVHTYPYEQVVAVGEPAAVAVRVLNHAEGFREVRVEAVAPPGWEVEPAVLNCRCEPKQEASLCFCLRPPASGAGRTVVPFRIHFGGVALGSLRECVVRVEAANRT